MTREDHRTGAEKRYDATALSSRTDPWEPIVETLLDSVGKPADTPIGTLSTGETIYGISDRTGRTGVVGTHIAGKYVTADDEGFLTVYMDTITIEGASRAELAEMRRVLDAAELLFDAAGKWGSAE